VPTVSAAPPQPQPQPQTKPLEQMLIALHEIVGLDASRGLTQCNRNPKLYVSLLGKFVKAQEHTLENIRQALADGDAGTAQRLAHTLKGLCASMGAEPLRQTLLEIEQAVREGRNTDDIEGLIVPASAELTTLFASLRGALGLNQGPAAARPAQAGLAAPEVATSA